MVRYSRYFSQTQLVDLPSLKCTCAFIGAGYWGAAVRVADGTPGSVVLALWYSNSAVGKKRVGCRCHCSKALAARIETELFSKVAPPSGVSKGLAAEDVSREPVL